MSSTAVVTGDSARLQVSPESLNTLVPLGSLSPGQRQALLQESDTLYLFPGDILFESGQFDSSEYFLLSGDVTLTDANGNHTLEKGRTSLGALSPMLPRRHRARVAADAVVLKINRQRLDELLSWSQVAEHLRLAAVEEQGDAAGNLWLDRLLGSNLFLKVSPTNIGRVLQKLEPREVRAGDVIIREGAAGDCCYFVQSGEARVTRGSAAEPLAVVGAGHCFGEDALLKESPRNATVTMLSDGVLLVLQQQDFLSLLREPEVALCTLPQAAEEQRVLLDVRTQGEYSAGHLPRAASLPLHLLSLKARLLSADVRYAVYCNSGQRARPASLFLQQQGFDVKVLQPGLMELVDQLPQAALTRQDYLLRNGVVAL
ncbi:cyclic nucleotide-binding domain-containing protein [Pseudomaricurvus sp. HS19]|uniref:cyclic nucleotide-binding domain-containing protein n=1 Tax=Pseudomaricurvus sp. HS19 TaxID=2692626 RepID=UPI00136AA56B|nr:cyclic nucleotide-binding domain-containing protein [Pseudomaricurvus sp. HS19]MYM62465.1 cyclic nucleotide-binding domain-containing protein [Pseudomaricurvus sp. HS19]